MLPPIPQGLVPVTVQQDPARERPELQPVTPPQESESNSGVKLDDRRPPNQQQGRDAEADEQEQDAPEEELELLERAGKKAMSRKGLLVNLRV